MSKVSEKIRPRFHLKRGLFNSGSGKRKERSFSRNFSWDAGRVRLEGKTAIITGSNTGIGKWNALDFYRRGCRVIMACRDHEKGMRSVEDIHKKLEGSDGNGQLVVKSIDLSSLKSVRNFSEEMLDREQKIHILVNNAGVMMCPKQKTADGFEMQFGTNHLGHFLLTGLLLPKIIDSAPSRIINLSSNAYKVGKMDFDDINWEKTRYSPFGAYARSKLANVLFTKELAIRLKGTGVTVYAVHPGTVRTELGRHMDEVTFTGFRAIVRKCFGWCMKTPRQGAETSIYCAVDERAGKESGLFYADCRAIRLAKNASDPEDAYRLWQLSCRMVGILDSYPFPLEFRHPEN